MSGLRIGSLFSGVGGLDIAVEAFFDAETAWHCEYDENPSKVLAARWPGVPNLGDITAVDWSTVEPVDIVCGGSPCQSSGRTSVEHSAPMPSAVWNPNRDCWESTDRTDLLSGLSAVSSETFPPSGMTRSGRLFPLPTSAPLTGGSVSSFLPTPAAYDSSRGGTQHPEKRRAGGHQPSLADVVEHL